MDNRVLLVLFLVSSFWYCNARDLTANHFSGRSEIVTVQQSKEKLSEIDVHVKEVSKNGQLCTLCEEFAADALNYLEQNKTQTEIIAILHNTCSKIPSFKQQCIVLVDYYAPLFFMEVSTIKAEGFCKKVALCVDDVTLSQRVTKNRCDVCHNVISEAIEKLKDPDTELEIVELLLKACSSIGKNVQKCKRLVFEYAPIILVNAQQFLEANDLCTILHACDSPTVVSEEVPDSSMHAAS